VKSSPRTQGASISHSLALDLGQTGTRARIVGHARTYRGPGLALGAEIVEAAADAVACAAHELLPDRTSVDTVSLGLTGYNGRVPDGEALLEAVSLRWKVAQLVAADDAITAFLGAIGSRPGVVVAAGTGVAVFALGSDGSTAHADGHGPFVGDWGGGYWIGARGIASALRAGDGRTDGSRPLAERARERFGSPATLSDALWTDPGRVITVASFAEDVALCASEGDEVARAILESAGQELAHSAAAAAGRVDHGNDFVVSWTGGVFAAGEPLVMAYVREIERLLPLARVEPPRGAGLDGAVALHDHAVRDLLRADVAVAGAVR
jgi:glucosamine kinase